MIRAQSSCREIQGKESAEFFHYGIDFHERAFWRGFVYLVDSNEVGTNDYTPPVFYLDADKSRGLRFYNNGRLLLENEELKKKTTIDFELHFRSVKILAHSYMPLSPKE